MIYNNPIERTKVTYPFVWWDGAFTTDELDKIISYCDGQGFERAKIMGSSDDVELIRRCDIKFYQKTEDTGWIFDKLNGVIEALNNQFYKFDLNGYDSFQYTSYNSAEHGMYGWHMDTCLGWDHLPMDMIEPRKLSLTLLLNDDFEGGDLEFNIGHESSPSKPEMIRGRIVAFPSFVIHRVKPVTKGFRKSVVVWVTGPKFK